ncbi:TfuA-related McrA-glycine thioamidation protein [Methanotorris formicicus]|nr:TfuA-related McrA-glycine thioamidation protein [Methanotorris formicicus]
MKIAIFSKLTLKEDEIKAIIDADVFPPIKRGDLLSPGMNKYDVIGIIDGVFLQNTAVGHREILYRLKEGKVIFGAGSMGALRASELDVYSMIGVGEVYKLYKEGAIVDDDEVAVTFDDDFNQISFSLVSFRFMVKNAVEKGLISKEEGDLLIKIAKSLYYPLRTFKNVLDKTDFSEEKKEKLLKFFESEEDIKRKDAFEMLYRIKDFVEKSN